MSHFIVFFGCLLLCTLFIKSYAGTSISVANQYKDELNVKIQGAGVGGCDVILQSGMIDQSDCWCLWGTINYSFCAYKKSPIGTESSHNATESAKLGVASGTCPIVTGESLVCSDLSSLGNCYDGAYSCTIDSNGLCHCSTV